MRILITQPLFRRCILLALCLGFFSSRSVIAQAEAPAQEGKTVPLYLEAITLNSLHSYLTDSWVTVELTVANPNAESREGRVVIFYASQPDAQFARDIWVPGRSTMSTWLLVGPAPKKESGVESEGSRSPGPRASSMELQALIYERTGDKERLLLPKTEERVRTRAAIYKPREPVTSLMLDIAKTQKVYSG